MQVLVVEDNPLVQKLVPAVLEKAFGTVQVHSAQSLEDAFKILAHEAAPDLAILDLGLPGHTGVDTLRRFRWKFPAIPVVVFSVTEDPASVRVARQMGAVGYIPKSLNADQMVEALKAVAEGGSFFPPA
jgi:DNA-binding NarL/FixJ family response regulator